jgi:iron complex transport system substrate-binding protein
MIKVKKLPLHSILLIAVLLFVYACTPANPQGTVTASPGANMPVKTKESSATPASPEVIPSETPSGLAFPLVMSDGLGRNVTLQSVPERIISLAPSNTEILFAIGAEDQLIGRDTFSDFPEKAQDIPDIGGGYGELNTELIVSMKPDLVLAAELTPPEQIKALEDLGLNVFLLKNPVTFEEMYANLVTVGKITGHEDQAASLVEQLKSRVSAVKEKIPIAQSRPLVFYELDGTDPDNPWTPGPGTFIDTLISDSGGENIGHDLGSQWPQISVEELIKRNPEIIILGDYTWGGVTPDDVTARNAWDAMDAVKNGKVYTFDDNLVSRPGPRMVDGLETMAKLLHPDLFP